MARMHNFSAGPATLPEPVLREAQTHMLDFAGSGISVLETSHRSAVFGDLIDDTRDTLRRLLGIPSNYHILFFQGGATLQFSAIPLNLMRTRRAGYVLSGNFSRLAQEEACKYGDAVVLASSADTGFDRIPDLDRMQANAGADELDYIHICQNNTVFGTMFHELPHIGATPLVADISSCLLTMPLDIGRYGLIYAGTQKNAGASGLTLVIVRDDLIEDGPACARICPAYLDYRLQDRAGSMYNTPNTFGIYLCNRTLHWVERAGA